MRADNALRVDAMNLLMNGLGEVEAERFIYLIKRENFDYTEWQKKLWDDMSIDEVYKLAANRETARNTPAFHKHALDNNAEIMDEITEKCIIIKITQKSIDRFKSDISNAIYEATRASWTLRIDRAKKADYVLSALNGVVRAVYSDMQWSVDEEQEGFVDWDTSGMRKRWKFDAKEAPENIKQKYIGKQIPSKYRQRGAAFPCIYINC